MAAATLEWRSTLGTKIFFLPGLRGLIVTEDRYFAPPDLGLKL